MATFLSRRLEGLVQSDIRYMTRECDRAGGINLGQGLCDLPAPEIVRATAAKAIDAQKNAYSYPEGTVQLREAIANKLSRENGLELDPSEEIVVTIGASGAYASSINALLDPGDGILLMEPYYGYHLNAAIVAGLEPQFVSLRPPAFRLDEEDLERALRPNTRAIVVCTPSNPSGRMFDEGELRVLERVAVQNDLLVLTDEVYEYVRFDARPHISPATIGSLSARTVTITSLSKTFSITGWRIGYAAAPAPLARAITLVNDLYYVCAPTPLQHAVAAGFAEPSDYFESLGKDFERKRNRICGALETGGLSPIVPEGAYYVLADVSRLDYPSAREAALGLLERVGVASIPGSAFFRGDDGERLVRFCFAKSDDELEEACKRLESLPAS